MLLESFFYSTLLPTLLLDLYYSTLLSGLYSSRKTLRVNSFPLYLTRLLSGDSFGWEPIINAGAKDLS